MEELKMMNDLGKLINKLLNLTDSRKRMIVVIEGDNKSGMGATSLSVYNQLIREWNKYENISKIV